MAQLTEIRWHARGERDAKAASIFLTRAFMQVNPDVTSVYLITPQTELMHKFADYVSNGKVDTELICADLRRIRLIAEKLSILSLTFNTLLNIMLPSLPRLQIPKNRSTFEDFRAAFTSN